MPRLLAFILLVRLSLPAQSFLPESAAFSGAVAEIPMRDGKSLAADVVVPKHGGRFPVVLVQTPYDRTQLRAAFTGQGRQGPDSIFTDASYAFVVTDWRGRFGSRAALTSGQAANLAHDGFDTIAWIVKQEWSNGKVATWGPSALGRVQYETARANPAGLIAAVPMVMPLNLTYEIYFPGGSLWDEFVRTLMRLGFGDSLYRALTARPVKNQEWATLEAGYVRGEDIRVPMLFIGGWYDIYTDGVLDAFHTVRARGGEKARAHSRLVVGPWEHTTDIEESGALKFPEARGYGMKKTRAWMDHWLRGISNGIEKDPAITYFQMGVNEWRTTEVWPPKGVVERTYFLHGNRELSTAAPEKHELLTFRFDPANPVPTAGGHVLSPQSLRGPQDQRQKVESREDVLAFTSEPLASDLTVAGKPRIALHVSSDRPDTDFTAILSDVYPDGRSMLAGEGILRMRFRNSMSREEFMQPGRVYSVTIDLPNVAITFPKGHCIRLLVSSSNYPRYAVNLNDGGPMYTEGKGQVAVNSVHSGREHPSALALPVAGR
ncbi:MAG: CocE/NonD family hydrolase [Acidobacteria bacterium]|nr:CocE/NonD family hydrolase [Acidobacteriota bacterium]